MKDLAGKTAFVTGAGSGIGLGIATALAQAGVKVMLCDIEQAALVDAHRRMYPPAPSAARRAGWLKKTLIIYSLFIAFLYDFI